MSSAAPKVSPVAGNMRQSAASASVGLQQRRSQIVTVHDQASGIERAASDHATEQSTFRNDQVRDPVHQIRRGDQQRDHSYFEGKSQHGLRPRGALFLIQKGS